MAHVLGKLFWRDLERHHRGIGSLRLAPEVAAGWKQRILVKTRTSVTAAGEIIETSAPRTAAAGCACRKPMPPGDIHESRHQRGRVAGPGNGPGR
jgi:hypothetical protein